jgi:hypothetical protein
VHFLRKKGAIMAGFGDIDALKFKKVCDDVVTSLEALQRSLPKAEEDLLPQQTVTTAVGALTSFQEMAQTAEIPVGQTRKLLDLVRNPAILTALGSQQAELAGLLKGVEQMLMQKEDPKRVKGTEFDPLGQGR